MKKLLLPLLIITLSVSHLQGASLPKKTRAYLKIGYGISALLAGAASPIMGGLHLTLGQTLSKADDAVDRLKSRLKTKIQGRPLFARMKRSPLGNRLLSVAGKTEKVIDVVVDSPATLLNTSGGFYLAMPFFLIPLGLDAIKRGREELRRLSIANSDKMQIAGDKAKKS